ncbi:MAG: hypothetical protein GWN84_02975 [Gammaproteobacteria bacterium]|nr:hypothetical protein [Gammaproteobacteria bacterium]NIR82111.1 hypothetical protein [Gammaproteobacteria bacterium]NIR89344.1 hypothetical protein [Gammaproteobacteria bacterium]NIU03221.1 hypothetical protein [Gammaproteobacteria bacterium]NIV74516.1 hypothetical protein [Gammaproteobacteria bacterium]
MQAPVVVIGLGEMGGVFARGFLRAGHPVYPVTRETAPEAVAAAMPEPAVALVAVAENDLPAALEALPEPWRDRVGLLQNELLPRQWEPFGLDPTVAVVWFEKKPGQDVKVIIPTPVFGPAAEAVAEALKAVAIPARTLRDEGELLFELVRKNVYILTSNIAGLRVGGTVSELWARHRDLAQQVAGEVLDIQEWLTAKRLPRERLVEAMVEAFRADPEHKCTGRSAPGRLARALHHAGAAGLAVPTLRALEKDAEAQG